MAFLGHVLFFRKLKQVQRASPVRISHLEFVYSVQHGAIHESSVANRGDFGLNNLTQEISEISFLEGFLQNRIR